MKLLGRRNFNSCRIQVRSLIEEIAKLLYVMSRGQQGGKVFVTSLLVQLNNRGKRRNASQCCDASQ